MKTKPLTKAERVWLDELQEVLNRCPSKRIAFFTVGDAWVGLHDVTREDEIGVYQERNGGEWGGAASKIGADFDGKQLTFPNQVHSTCG